MSTATTSVDWDVAVATATRLVPPGPSIGPGEARAVVTQLRACAIEAQGHVRAYTQLDVATAGAAVAVIDRPGWIRANAAGFRTVLDPMVERLQQRRIDVGKPGSGSQVGDAVASRLTGVQSGGLLAFLSTKVLGQYELFSPTKGIESPAPGRLLLVAPNIVTVERELGVDPAGFRLWVCLHEETHRVQFGAAPWLREHIVGELTSYIDATDVDPAALLRRLKGLGGAAFDAVRGAAGVSLVEAFQSPQQREVLDRVTAVMSLLEGHADVVMDGVGPGVVPDVDDIRRKFARRRESATGPELLMRRLLGLEAKMRQYRDGAVFVRGVLERTDMATLNRVWESPDTLPKPHEIADAGAWVARVAH